MAATIGVNSIFLLNSNPTVSIGGVDYVNEPVTAMNIKRIAVGQKNENGVAIPTIVFEMSDKYYLQWHYTTVALRDADYANILGF